MKTNGRNINVERTVDRILARIDAFIEGEKLARLPSPQARAAIDAQIGHSSNSVRLASLFLVFYSTVDAAWNCNSIPTGIRGQWGDKRLATALGLRNITLHNAITAFGENLGWKGNVTAARLQGDNRFDGLSHALASMTPDDRERAADYMAARFAESRRVIAPLPPVGDDVLTFARARLLFYNLIGIPSESVREHHAGLHSFRSISLIDARRRNASALRFRLSQSLTSRLHRPSHANVRSTTQRFGRTTNPFA